MSETYDLFRQGQAHLRKGRAAQATVALEKAKRREPRKASIREALGIAYLRIQRYEEAEVEFRAMLELSPTDHYAHYALGRAIAGRNPEEHDDPRADLTDGQAVDSDPRARHALTHGPHRDASSRGPRPAATFCRGHLL